MRLIIVSDSHGNRAVLEELVNLYGQKVDGFIHCGDSELSSQDSLWSRMDTVAGNCDFEQNFPNILMKHHTVFPFLVVHGHNHQVKNTLEFLLKEAKEAQVDCVFYGHSHVLKFDYTEGVLLINPGSIEQPRGKLSVGTYCLLTVSSKQVAIQVFTQNHQELSAVNQTWQRDSFL